MVDFPGAGDGPNPVAVRTIAQSGTNIWVGGRFSEIDDANGHKVADASDLGVFDSTTGTAVSGVHLPLVTLSTGVAEVLDSSLGPDGLLYLAGNFDAVDGATRNGVAAIDPTTGALQPFAPNVGEANSVLARADAVYVGTDELLSFQLDGDATSGYAAPQVFIDPTLRGDPVEPAFRDIQKRGDTLVAACQCDSLTDAGGTRTVKVAVQIDATSGDWVNWRPAGQDDSQATVGISTLIHNYPGSATPTIYLATGANDFVAAYDFATGAQRFRTDTSGSNQALAWYQGALIDGGLFNWSAKPGTSGNCGDNAAPNTLCFHTPKLVGMSATDGHVLLGADSAPWNPGICCGFNGVWALLTGNDGSSLHVGGEFTQAGGTWADTLPDPTGQNWNLTGAGTHKNYARFSGPIGDAVLTVSLSGTGHGTITSMPSGLNCPGTCMMFPLPGTTVTLTASPAPGSVFTGWSGDCSGTSTCQVRMNASRSVNAVFNVCACGGDRLGDNDPAVAYNGWSAVADAGANGGFYRMSSVKNDRAIWKSTATTSITWVARTGPDGGRAAVLIDGVKQGTVDLYSVAPATLNKVYSGMSNAAHTIVIKVLHTNKASSSDYNVRLDAFVVGATTVQESDPKLQYDTWKSASQALATDATYRSATAATATTTVTFTGSAIDWITTMGKGYGKASVTLDGVSKGTFDMYQTATAWQHPVSFNGLSSGPHTLVIQVLGQKNAYATSTKVVVDGFVVHA